MAVANASIRGLERGIALPLLRDLARKPVSLHDNSVRDLDTLLKTRGALSPTRLISTRPRRAAIWSRS